MDEVFIYSEQPIMDVKQLVNDYFGGFNNDIFYDLVILLAFLTFLFIGFKIVTLPFRSRKR